jgi:hypothetical protein
MRFWAGVGGCPGIFCAFSFFVSVIIACMALVSVAPGISVGFDPVRFLKVLESDFEMKVGTTQHLYLGGSSTLIITGIVGYFVAIHNHAPFKIGE